MQCTSICFFNESITAPNWSYPNITRPFSILYYVLGGSAFYTIDGVEKPFEKGHLYILPADRVYSLREKPNDKLNHLFIHAFTSPKIHTLIDVDVAKDEFLAQTMQSIRTFIKRNEAYPYILHLTDMLLSYISEILSLSDVPLHTQIRNYIEEHFIDVFKYNDLSEHFNYSAPHISKIFRHEYNLTPRQYAKQLILQEIVSLLRREISVAEIADRLEFSSPENMSRFFKGCYGYSPTEYLKHFKSAPF